MANQIYAIANALAKNLGYTASNVIDVKKVKGSLFPFLSGVKPEEMEDLKAWANGIVAQLQD